MDNGVAEDSICVSANTGNVGTVSNNECVMNMGIRPNSESNNPYVPNYWLNATFFEEEFQPLALLNKMYPSFNTYNGDEAQSTPDFYALSSSCKDAFEWVSAENFSLGTSVHTPSTWQLKRSFYRAEFGSL